MSFLLRHFFTEQVDESASRKTKLRRMFRVLCLLPIGFLFAGCAAVAPLTSLIGTPHGDVPGLQVHEQTSVNLARDNFVLVKTNLVGQSKGFSLLGFITMHPATLTKAMSRMYASAQMPPGRPETLAHLIIEHSNSYWILFGIPKVEVRADVVAFRPEPSSTGPLAAEPLRKEAGPPTPALTSTGQHSQ